MPQMLAIQPAEPKALTPNRPSGSSGQKKESEFSPHLKKAVSQNKSRQDAPEKSRQEDQVDKKVQKAQSEKSKEAENSEEAKDSEKLEKACDKQDELKKKSEQSYLELLFAGSSEPITAKSILAQLQQGGAATNPPQTAKVETGAAAIAAEKSAGTLAIPSEPSTATEKPTNTFAISPELSAALEKAVDTSAIPAEGSAPTAKSATSGSVRKQDALVDQLQQLIDKEDKNGKVSVFRVDNNPKSQSGITDQAIRAQPVAEGAKPEVITIADKAAETLPNVDAKPALHPTGNRHDSQQNYFQTKVSTQDSTDSSHTFQEHRQENQLSQKTMGSGLTSGPLSGAEQTNTFAQVSAMATQTAGQPNTDAAQPIVLPSGMIVREQEIMAQLADRLQLSGKQMDSRINLKLHPAELGELKIDLTVKGGAIRANVVAQSHHTLEIIEKNIPKLRTILEHQGFTVDQISVTADSDPVGDFDLFDRQLFSRDDYTPTTPKGRRSSAATFSLDTGDPGNSAPNSGVNVTI